MRTTDGKRQRGLTFRDYHEMDMVLHKAVTKYLEIVFLTLKAKDVKISVSVSVCDENSLGIVTFMGNMMWDAW